jgi:spore germination protein GerM
MPRKLKTKSGKKIKCFLCIAVILVVATIIYIKFFSSQLRSSPAIAFEWEKPVDVYFWNTNMGSADDCSKVFPVSRKILNAETLGLGSLDSLLKGVSDEEKQAGYFTSINSGVLIKRFNIVDGVAFVDFNSKLSSTAGSCMVVGIKSQIEKTLTSLPDIDYVVITVDGKTDGILEP